MRSITIDAIDENQDINIDTDLHINKRHKIDNYDSLYSETILRNYSDSEVIYISQICSQFCLFHLI